MAKFISATLVACRNSDGELLMVQEGKEHVHGRWDFPGGGLEHDESVKRCGEREVREETGYEIEVNGFYGVYLETSDTTDLPVIVYLLDGEITGQGEANHHFDGEILDHGFYSEEELQQLELRKDNRISMLKDIRNKEPLPVERLKDLR